MVAAPDPAAWFDPSELALRRGLESTHYWHLHRREVIRREVAALVSPGGVERLLDVGCGIGTVATHLNASGFTADYLDVFEEALAIARDRARARLAARVDSLRFVRGDVTRPLPVDGADGILLLDVIEHLPDDVGALANARAALNRPADRRDRRADPFVLVTVPAFPSLWSPWDVLERHQRRYTRTSLDRALRAAGLTPVRMTHFFFPLFFAAAAVQGMRSAGAALRRAFGAAPAAPPRDILDTVEATDRPLLNELVLALTAPERAWLPGRHLPLGTSLLAVARPCRTSP